MTCGSVAVTSSVVMRTFSALRIARTQSRIAGTSVELCGKHAETQMEAEQRQQQSFLQESERQHQQQSSCSAYLAEAQQRPHSRNPPSIRLHNRMQPYKIN